MRLHSLLAKVLLAPLNILPLPLIVVAITVIGIDTPLALADSISATASVKVSGCSASDTLTGPGSIMLLNCESGGTPPFAFVVANLGLSSGQIVYEGQGAAEFGLGEGMINASIDIAGEIMAPGNSGTSTITFEFMGFSSSLPMGCGLTFDGQTTNCTVPATGSVGVPNTVDLDFVVQNGQAYNYDLKLGADQTLLDFPSETFFQYSVPFVVTPVPEPVSLVLLLSGFAPLVFRRKPS